MENNEHTLEMMVQEISEVYAKYGLSKTIGIVPNQIEVTINRIGIDDFEVQYSEYFNHLPKNILLISLQNAENLLIQMGIQPENITKLENGIRTVLNGDFSILMQPLIEILLQNYRIEEDMDFIFESLKRDIPAFLSMLNLRYIYNDEIRREIIRSINDYNEKAIENPNIAHEINEILEKYMSKQRKFFREL